MPERKEYIFQDRVVIYIDVLGFKEKLKDFEKEAIKNIQDGSEFYYSNKVNDFVGTFKEVVSSLDKENINYYLFSDNICITVDYLSDKTLLPNVLLKISDLFYEFASKGYFLRGGIDVGKFIDERLIAVGIPLSTAYEIENTKAIYPRIVLSDNFVSLAESYAIDKDYEYSDLFTEGNLILTSCEIKYLNIFFNIINKDDKHHYLETFRKSVIQNLKHTEKREQIHVKYEWLVKEYNHFIDYLTSELIYTDDENVPTDEEVELIRNLKI